MGHPQPHLTPSIPRQKHQKLTQLCLAFHVGSGGLNSTSPVCTSTPLTEPTPKSLSDILHGGSHAEFGPFKAPDLRDIVLWISSPVFSRLQMEVWSPEVTWAFQISLVGGGRVSPGHSQRGRRGATTLSLRFR